MHNVTASVPLRPKTVRYKATTHDDGWEKQILLLFHGYLLPLLPLVGILYERYE